MLTDCSIQTEEPDETLDFDFSSANVLNKIIMKVQIFTFFTCLSNWSIHSFIYLLACLCIYSILLSLYRLKHSALCPKCKSLLTN